MAEKAPLGPNEPLAARLAAAEADREARLAVIQKQGAELGRIPELVAERDALVAERDGLVAERDALAVERDSLVAREDALAAELSSLRSILEDVRRQAEGTRPKTLLGMASPSEVRRLADVLSSIATLAQPRRGRT